MSFFSSLEVFYPGRPPSLTVGELRKFCDGLRSALAVEHNRRLHVSLKYGAFGKKAFDALHEVKWDRSGMVGRLPLEEDRQPEEVDHKHSDAPWSVLWPDTAFDHKTVLRAYIHLGSLPKGACRDLTAHDPAPEARSYIVPDCLSVSISPVYAMTLATEPPQNEDECYGFLSLCFPGNGYFTWQPLDAYWQVAGHTDTVRKTLQLCREAWPAPAFGGWNTLKEALGERFLNRDPYKPGDWVVSVSESG